MHNPTYRTLLQSVVVSGVVLMNVLNGTAQVTGVDAVAMSVSDLDRSVVFYTQVLPFKKVSESEAAGADLEKLYGVFGVRVRTARLQLGDEFIELRQFLAPEGRPIPIDARSNDRWFQHIAIIVSDMDKAYAYLHSKRVRHASPEPQRLPDWNKAAGGIQAFYFKDPDGHPLEILAFPAGKGDPKWHRTDRRALFLGIDHTAIVVASTADSVRFYTQVLGMSQKGESENFGTEQEHLNNVRGAHLKITGLRAASGPGVEFLEYVTPKDGKRYPPEWGLNDLGSTQTILSAQGLEKEAAAARQFRAVDISGGMVVPATASLGLKRGLSLRDPDGHAILIREDR